jgi:hypothetical protein
MLVNGDLKADEFHMSVAKIDEGSSSFYCFSRSREDAYRLPLSYSGRIILLTRVRTLAIKDSRERDLNVPWMKGTPMASGAATVKLLGVYDAENVV